MPDAVRFRYSAHGEAKRSRIRRLPEFLGEELRAVLKRDAVGVIRAWQHGIGKNGLGLKRLAESTIAGKIRKGYRKPKTPLYGAGEDEKRSYINALKLRRLKNGWKVFVSWAKHHESDLKLSALFIVHEFGATINTGRALIRIPPRPAFSLGFRKYMKSRRRREPTREVKRAITELIETGRAITHRRIVRRANEAATRDLYEI